VTTPTGFTRNGQPITVEALTAAATACVLCQVPNVAVVGVWSPTAEAEAQLVAKSERDVGPVRPGKYRVAFYGLCAACAMIPQPALAERVEARLLGTAP
jgi:hypothetical protein